MLMNNKFLLSPRMLYFEKCTEILLFALYLNTFVVSEEMKQLKYLNLLRGKKKQRKQNQPTKTKKPNKTKLFAFFLSTVKFSLSKVKHILVQLLKHSAPLQCHSCRLFLRGGLEKGSRPVV